MFAIYGRGELAEAKRVRAEADTVLLNAQGALRTAARLHEQMNLVQKGLAVKVKE